MRRPAHGATIRPGPCRPASGFGGALGRPGPRADATPEGGRWGLAHLHASVGDMVTMMWTVELAPTDAPTDAPRAPVTP